MPRTSRPVPGPYLVDSTLPGERGLIRARDQEYLAQLSTSITPEMLSAKGVKLVVIGCGHWSTIKPYREVVGCPFPFYADPTRALYDELDLKSVPLSPSLEAEADDVLVRQEDDDSRHRPELVQGELRQIHLWGDRPLHPGPSRPCSHHHPHRRPAEELSPTDRTCGRWAGSSTTAATSASSAASSSSRVRPPLLAPTSALKQTQRANASSRIGERSVVTTGRRR